MINKIIKDWVGKYKQANRTSDKLEDNPYYVGGYNKALQNLTSRIPELEERIEKEIKLCDN